jgi:hypothetical protein
MPARGHISQIDGHLRVDAGNETADDIAAIYRDVAVLCIEKQVRRVLVKPGEDPLGERYLRNALTTMVLAGLPAEFRIALVAETPRIAARYRTTENDLCLAGIHAKIFDAEDTAMRWLKDSSFSAGQRG